MHFIFPLTIICMTSMPPQNDAGTAKILESQYEQRPPDHRAGPVGMSGINSALVFCPRNNFA